MNTQMKQELINDILTGLLVSAALAAAVPADCLAKTFSEAATLASSNIGAPFVKVVSYISYGLGTVMTVAGIAGAKKHSDNPGSNPLTPALGKLGAGAAFLAAPYLVEMMQSTGTSVLGTTNAAVKEISF